MEASINLRDLQKEDESLKEPLSKVTETEGEKKGIATALTGDHYFIRDGLLFHQPEGGSVEQVVVPQCLREKVLALGHDVPLAGHLGNVKTLERIARRFYWPGLYTDVLRYC